MEKVTKQADGSYSVTHGGYGLQTKYLVEQVHYAGSRSGYVEVIKVLEGILFPPDIILLKYTSGKGTSWEYCSDDLDAARKYNDEFNGKTWKTPYRYEGLPYFYQEWQEGYERMPKTPLQSFENFVRATVGGVTHYDNQLPNPTVTFEISDYRTDPKISLNSKGEYQHMLLKFKFNQKDGSFAGLELTKRG